MFDNVKLDEKTLGIACKQAETNWRWWQKDFKHNEPFGRMPIFHDYPRFLGFGFDYSVFRGLSRGHLEYLQKWFSEQSDPDSFEKLFESFSSFAKSKGLHNKSKKGNWPNRVSLISKILCLWKPEEYPMWDTLARKGLKKLHNSTRKHCYLNTNASDYLIFQSDFFKLHDTVKDHLIPTNINTPKGATADIFSFRVLDSYLMETGK